MKDKIKKLMALEGTDLLIFGIAVFAFSWLIEKIFNAGYIECDLSIVRIIALVFGAIGFVCFVYSLINAIKHAKNNKEWKKSERKKKIILLCVFNIYYLPVYYTCYVYTDKNRKWWGILDMVLYIICTAATVSIFLFGVLLVDIIIPNGTKEYHVGNEKFSLILNENFECSDGKKDDSYSFFCENSLSEEEIMVFDYPENPLSKEEIIEFHANQEKDINKDLLMSEKTENGNTILEFNSNGTMIYRIVSLQETSDNSSYVIIYTYEHKNNFDEILSNITISIQD